MSPPEPIVSAPVKVWFPVTLTTPLAEFNLPFVVTPARLNFPPCWSTVPFIVSPLFNIMPSALVLEIVTPFAPIVVLTVPAIVSFPSIVAPSKVSFPLAELRVAEPVEISLIVKLPPLWEIVPFPKLSPVFKVTEPLFMVKFPFILTVAPSVMLSFALFKVRPPNEIFKEPPLACRLPPLSVVEKLSALIVPEVWEIEPALSILSPLFKLIVPPSFVRVAPTVKSTPEPILSPPVKVWSPVILTSPPVEFNLPFVVTPLRFKVPVDCSNEPFNVSPPFNVTLPVFVKVEPLFTVSWVPSPIVPLNVAEAVFPVVFPIAKLPPEIFVLSEKFVSPTTPRLPDVWV